MRPPFFQRIRFLWPILALVSGPALALASPTFTPVAIGTNGCPRGYWEFLPSAYPINPTKTFPLVIYFHGLGQGGAGAVGPDLNKVLANEVAKNLNTPADPIRALLDQNGVIVLCPQIAEDTWWTDSSIRPVLDYAVAHYRVDPTRIYLTGLSAGCSGITDFVNIDLNAVQVTAFLVCAYRGSINAGAPAALAKVCPFWLLTSRGDWSSNPDVFENLLAGALLGTGSTNCMANYPGGSTPTADYTGAFLPSRGWKWVVDYDSADGVNPKFTVLTGTAHNSWTRTYDHVETWNWLLAQKKPDVTITSPAAGALVSPGVPVTLAASAKDMDGNPLTGSSVQWSSSIDGALGTGATLTVSKLSVGSHVITCLATDGKFRGRTTQTTLTVPYAGAFAAQFDFGSGAAGYPTVVTGWNNIQSPSVGSAGSIVTNALNSAGAPVGVRVEITQAFENPNTSGVVSATLYPSTAQSDSLYVDGTNHAVAQVLTSGLNPAQNYTFTFFASRSGSGNRNTIYTVNGQSVTLNASDNINQTSSLANLVPDPTGHLTLKVSIASGAAYGYLGVLTISTSGPSQSSLQTWRSMQGLAVDGSQDLLTPAGDGVTNLMKYAFNLAPAAGDLNKSNAFVMTATGGKGLPLIASDGAGHLSLTFVRRNAATNPGVTYIPEVNNDLSAAWTPLGATPSVATIDSTWERVTYTDTATSAGSERRFTRVRLTSP